MKKILPFLLLFIITVAFFYKSIFFRHIPFPGDLLISEYAPWKYESYLGYNPGSYPSKAQYFDVARQLYPWKMLVVDEIRNGRIPLWNPYNFSGSPLLANIQSAVFNPFNLIFFILSTNLAWTFYIIIQPLLASCFMYIYLRKLKLSSKSSLFGGLSFGFSLYMSTFIEYGNFGYTILWLPLGLYFIEKIRESFKISILLFPIIVSLIIFSGHLQLAIGILLLFFIYIGINPTKRILLWGLLFLGIGISCVQLIPSGELLFYSARTSHEFKNVINLFLLQFHQLILFISPDAYGNPATRNFLLKDTYPGNAVFLGSVPLLFALISILKTRKNYYVKFYAYFAIILLIFLTNNPLSHIFYMLNLPVISTSSPSNYIFLLTFTISVLSAFGVDLWYENKKQKVIWILIIALIFFAGLFFIHRVFSFEISNKQFLIGFFALFLSSIIIFLGSITQKKILFVLLFAITFVELFYYFQKFNPFVPVELMYPKTQIVEYLKKYANLDRFWGIGSANIESNLSTEFRTYSPEGYDPLYPQWYSTFINERNDISSRSDAVIRQPDISRSVFDQQSTQEKIDQLSVRLVLDREENGASDVTFEKDKYKLINKIGGWKIMENTNFFPRVFVAPKECAVGSNYSKCYQKDLIDSASIISYSPNRVEINSGMKEGLLIFSDTYYPGWKVLVNGKMQEIIKLPNGTRGVENVKPNAVIIFEYNPSSFKLGLIITIISIGSLILITRLKINEK